MGNENSQSSDVDLDALKSYQTLMGMGFDDALSFQASQKYGKNLDKAIEYVLKNQTKTTHIPHDKYGSNDVMNVPAEEQKLDIDKSIFMPANITTDCESINNCLSINRIKSLLKVYSHYKNNSSFMDLVHSQLNEQYTLTNIMNDYIHIINNHTNSDDHFEDIYNILNIKCKLDNCIGLRRNQRVEMNNNDGSVIMDIMDQMHTYLLHSFDTGFKLTKKERQLLNQGDGIEYSFNQMRKLLSQKRKIFSNITQSQNNAPSKFVTEVNDAKHDDEDNDDKDNDDMDEKKTKDDGKNSKQNKSAQHNKGNEIHDTYSFSYRFNYLKEELTEKTLKDKRYQDIKDKILFVKRKYKDLKDEILNNKIHKLDMNKYQQAIEKAAVYLGCDFAKSLTLKPRILSEFWVDCTYFEKQFNQNHLTVLILYTDYDTLSHKFSSTFRHQNRKETMQQLISRHKNYYWFARHLREAVEGYGDAPRSFLDPRIRSYYHGISTKLLFTSVIGSFYCPMSTTKDITVAQTFATNDGIILKIQKFWNEGSHLPLPYFECEWFSRFAFEKEVLFFGGSHPMEITTIIDCSTGQNYGPYLKAFGCMQGLTKLDCVVHSDVNVEDTVRSLLNKEKTILPSYIVDLWTEYVNKRREIAIRIEAIIRANSEYLSSLFLTKPQTIKHLGTEITAFIKLETIGLLLPKCEVIWIVNRGIYSGCIFISKEYIETVATELTKHEWPALREIHIPMAMLDENASLIYEDVDEMITSMAGNFAKVTNFSIQIGGERGLSRRIDIERQQKYIQTTKKQSTGCVLM